MHNICCAFVGMDNKLYKMHGMYIKKQKFIGHDLCILDSLRMAPR